jgi:hypothetical protein
MPHNYVKITVISGLDMLIFLLDCDMYGTIPVFVHQDDICGLEVVTTFKK